MPFITFFEITLIAMIDLSRKSSHLNTSPEIPLPFCSRNLKLFIVLPTDGSESAYIVSERFDFIKYLY